MTDLIKIVEEAIKHPRTQKEITKTFEAAGIIDKKGNLKYPYEDIEIPSLKT